MQNQNQIENKPNPQPDWQQQQQQDYNKKYQELKNLHFPKGCLELGHHKNKPLFICTNKQCSYNSSLVCSQCILEKKHEDHLINLIDYQELIENYRQNNINLSNYPLDNLIQLIYKNAPADESDIYNADEIKEQSSYIREIENFLDELAENFKAKIYILKKEIKINSQVQILQLKKLGQQYKKKIEEAFSLDPIMDSLQQLKDNQIDIQQLNHQIKEFSRNKELQLAQKTLIEEIKKQRKEELEKEIALNPAAYRDKNGNPKKLDQCDNSFKILNPKANHLIQQKIDHIIEEIPKQLFTKLGNLSSYIPEFKNYQGQEFTEYLGDNIYQGLTGGYDNMHSETFDRDKSVQIRFKLLSDLQSYFFISLNHGKGENVTQKYFWMPNSFGTTILKQQSSNTTFEQKGKRFYDDGKKGDIYQININLPENLFEIINEQNESSIKCTGNLKSISQKFHIAIGSNISCPGWKIQFL